MKLKVRGLVFVGFAAAVFVQSALAVDPDDKTVTSKTYVDSKIDAVTGAGSQESPYGSTTISSDSPNNKAPSSQNVYKFVTDQMGSLDAVANIQGDGTYLSVDTASVGGEVVKQVNVITDNLASTAALIEYSADSNATAADEGKLTTAKAVYDFVNGTGNDDGFQPKITDNLASSALNINSGEDAGVGVMVGYKSYNGTTYGDSTWLTFAAAANHTDSETASQSRMGYLNITEDNTNSKHKYLVDIKGAALAKNAAAIDAVYTASGDSAYQTNDKLATAKAVYDYVQGKIDAEINGATTISSGSGNNVVPTSKNVFDFVTSVTNGNTLPTMNSACVESGVHCALVTVYHAADNNHPSAYTTLEWTVMAQ